MRYLLAILLLLAGQASAQVLVRHCDTPTATACATTPIWVKPASAINVQVNRTGAPFVALSAVQPTERIAACYDTAIQPGSSATCAVKVPNRSDLWELKSVLYPPVEATGQIVLSWNAVTTDSKGDPFDGTAGYVVSRQQDVCGPNMTDPRCGTMPWVSEDVGPVTQKTFAGISGRWCFRVQGRTAAGDLGVISVPDEDDCAIAIPLVRVPGPVQNIKATSP